MAVIELNNVSFTYPDASAPAIKNLSLQVEKGQFIVLFGASGSGKSTLLRLLKKEIQPHGDLTGKIKINGKSISDHEGLTNDIGFVFQDPENQVVAEDVLHEIAFGLENMGLSTNEMRSRVAEMVHFFGAESMLERKTHELSGGKKQQINLASALLMQPNLLLLDEPTAQLDPVSTREFLDMLVRLNEEFGMTIILAEHRLEEVCSYADKIIMMNQGQISLEGNPKKIMQAVWDSENRPYVPSIPALFLNTVKSGEPPLTVKEGKAWVNTQVFKQRAREHSENHIRLEQITVKSLYFKYNKNGDFVLKDLNFALNKGEIYSLLGGNGSGKSTLLKAVGGILNPDRGRVLFQEKALKDIKNKEIARRVGYLPQNPKMFFLQDTVGGEIRDTIAQWNLKDVDEVDSILKELNIKHILNSHPYDLSGGELQKAALACILIRKPDVLLLDEPTKGLDPISKHSLAGILHRLNGQGITILMSTHDVEFAALHSTKCGMMFQGNVISENVPAQFFKGNFFYTTMIQRLFRNVKDNVIVSLEEAVRSWHPKEQ